jgi:lysophospholipase L1-like esterase
MSAANGAEVVLTLYQRVRITLLFALALLAFAEGVLRVVVPDVEIRTPLARGGLLRPYVPGSSADLVGADFRVRYAINEAGFRDLRGRALTSAHPGLRRVLLLGDSFSEGFGVEQDDTYARRLERSGRYEAWDLAVMGASPLFYVVLAREFVPRLAPDVVVVQLFDNDLDENQFRHLPREADGRIGALPDRLRPRGGAIGWLADRWHGLALVQAFERLERRLEGRPIERIFVRPSSRLANNAPPTSDGERMFPWYDPARAPEWDAKLAVQIVLLRQVVEELRASNTRVLIAYVPHVLELVAGDPQASRARNPHAQRLAQLARELAVPLLDGIDLFAARGRNPGDYYYPHDLHWNAAGHALFAEALEARLDALVP